MHLFTVYRQILANGTGFESRSSGCYSGVLEEEVTQLLGRRRYERRCLVDRVVYA